jgi:hypothetical protein
MGSSQTASAAPVPARPPAPPGPETRWQAPLPYGNPAAIDSMGTIAAPLLASVCIALIAIVLTSTAAFRWTNATLLLLVVAAGSFVATVECSFIARQYVVTPSDLEDWWPDRDVPERREMLRREQRYYVSQFRVWSGKARLAYNVGVLALSLGVVGTADTALGARAFERRTHCGASRRNRWFLRRAGLDSCKHRAAAQNSAADRRPRTAAK